MGSTPLRVLITHHIFPPDFAGGGEVVALHTALELQRRGHDVRVLTTGRPEDTTYDGIPTERLPIHPYRINTAARAIARSAREADIVHTFNYHACLPSLRAGRRTGCPVVRTVRDLAADPDRTRSIGARNHAAAQRYSWARYGDELESVYAEILDGRETER